MKILVDINHPAHVHFFKHFIWEAEKLGHDIMITATQKEITYQLLDIYKFEYTKLGTYGESLLAKLVNLPLKDWELFKVARKFNPDILLGIASFRAAHVARALGKKSYIFDDTEHSSKEIFLYKSFATNIFTPSVFTRDLGPKQIRYNAYHELAYLHPNRFVPNPSTLSEIGLTEHDTFFVIRFVSWKASHDIGQSGISEADKLALINRLNLYGKVLISSEYPITNSLSKYTLTICPTKIHDLLYFASMYIGEGATMASEAAILGTPSIYINSLTMGYIHELVYKYKIIQSFKSGRECIQLLDTIQDFKTLKDIWRKKKDLMVLEKTDLTCYMLEYFELELNS